MTPSRAQAPRSGPIGRQVACTAVTTTERPSTVILVRIPVKLETPNAPQFGMSRMAAFGKARRIRNVREVVEAHLRAARGRDLRLPTSIHIVRISAGTLDDDNLVACAKAALDSIAKVLGVNDRSFVIHGDRSGIRVTFGQRSEGRGVFGAEVTLRFDPCLSGCTNSRNELGCAPTLQGRRAVMDDRSNLLDLLARHAYDYSPGKYTLSSGAPSDEYLDCKNALSFPESLPSLGNLIVSEVGPKVVAVGGLTMGADPMAIGASFMSKGALRWFLVRKVPKPHGKKLLIDGNVEHGERVVVVDDVVTTGGSTIEAIDKCRAFGLQVDQVIVLVNREQNDGMANIQRSAGAGVPVKALYTKSEIKREWERQRQGLQKTG